MKERTNTKKGITKKMSCYNIKKIECYEINGYAKLVERQLEVHIGYDSKNEDAINPNGMHQLCLWMLSMSTLKREKNMAKSRATFPLKHISCL